MTGEAQAAGCPRTGRSRAITLESGALRPSDGLTAFLAIGVAWLAAGVVCELAYALGGPLDLRWLGLHLVFVGGVSQMVVGAAQFFACAALATSAPSRRRVQAELVVWNGATVCIAVGVPAGIVALTGAGGTLLLVGLALFSRELTAMRRRSIQRIPWATRWYQTAAAFLACGAVLGPVMASDTIWMHGSLLGAHLALNLGGWFGTAIVGTLHTFYPSLTETRLRLPRLQLPTYLLWAAGTGVIALSSAFALDGGAVAGWALILVAATLLLANLAATAASGRVASPAAAIVSVGQGLLAVAAAEGLALALSDGPIAGLVGPERDRLVVTLVAGWIGLTVLGSLVHLLGLMRRVRARPALLPTRRHDAWAMAGALLVVAGIAVLTTAGDGQPSGRALLAAGYLLLVSRAATLAWQALRAAPLGLWRNA